MSTREDDAASRFQCDDAQRACFEAGIKLATVYHQFTGTPFCGATREQLERAIEGCIRTQPYVLDVTVGIRTEGGDKSDQYTYTSLTGTMIDAVVKIGIRETVVTAEMRYDEKLDYPLMFISLIHRADHRGGGACSV